MNISIIAVMVLRIWLMRRVLASSLFFCAFVVNDENVIF
jgi:hypothetical protein